MTVVRTKSQRLIMLRRGDILSYTASSELTTANSLPVGSGLSGDTTTYVWPNINKGAYWSVGTIETMIEITLRLTLNLMLLLSVTDTADSIACVHLSTYWPLQQMSTSVTQKTGKYTEKFKLITGRRCYLSSSILTNPKKEQCAEHWQCNRAEDSGKHAQSSSAVGLRSDCQLRALAPSTKCVCRHTGHVNRTTACSQQSSSVFGVHCVIVHTAVWRYVFHWRPQRHSIRVAALIFPATERHFQNCITLSLNK